MSHETYDRDSILNIQYEVLDKAKFLKTASEKIAVRIANDLDSPLNVKLIDDTVVQITGGDSLHKADVILEGGIKKLQTATTVKVESLNGFDDISDNWFFINAVVDGGTVRIEIDVTDGAPLLDKIFTVNIGETRIQLAQRIVLELNQDFVNFQPYYKAIRVKDNPIVHISSKLFGEFGETVGADSFRVTFSAGMNVPRAFDDFIRRGKVTSLSRSDDDPRYGILGISGETVSRSGDIGGLLIAQPANGGSTSLLVNGSGVPVEFTFPMDALDDFFIRELRFFGSGNGIQFGQFISKNGTLTNGVEIEIKTDNEIITLPLVKSTEDFKNKFAFGSGDNFQLGIQSGTDEFLAVFISDSPFPLRAAGTFGAGNDDYIKIIINDNLNSGLATLESLAFGFRREA